MNIPEESTSKPYTMLTVSRKPLPDRDSYSLCITVIADESPKEFRIAEDVTESADAALSFAKLLAEEQISPHHFADIVEDALPLK